MSVSVLVAEGFAAMCLWWLVLAVPTISSRSTAGGDSVKVHLKTGKATGQREKEVTKRAGISRKSMKVREGGVFLIGSK